MIRVLIVDDSPSETLHFKTVLGEAGGFEVVSVNSGELGIEQAQTFLPDLILMDVVMGGMSGFQATRSIRQIPALVQIPIIMVTTKDQPTDRVWAKRQGASAYLTKPVDGELLLTTIDDLLQGKEIQD